MKVARERSWTEPGDARARLRQRWDRGDFLAAPLRGDSLFPLRFPLKGPTSGELAEDFSKVRDWIARWRKHDPDKLEWRQFNHRVFGPNAVPTAVVFKSVEALARAIGTLPDLHRFRSILEITQDRLPALVPWLARRPLQALDLAADWDRLLSVVEWIRLHPRPGIYLRQMDLPGVHTKFVEAHRKTLAEWLDLALPPEAIDDSARGADGFNRRYRFRDKPERIRFRFLERARAPLSGRVGLDLTVDAAAFHQLSPDVSRIFITENEVNFLAFPELPDSLLVFGSGYGWSTFCAAQWLTSSRIYYWGDIDTHGFAILDQLRSHLPHVESFLMDRDTFEQCRTLWGEEPQPTRRDLPRLNAQEQTLYNDLRDNRIGPNLRLEQERIPFSRLQQALAMLREPS